MLKLGLVVVLHPAPLPGRPSANATSVSCEKNNDIATKTLAAAAAAAARPRFASRQWLDVGVGVVYFSAVGCDIFAVWSVVAFVVVIVEVAASQVRARLLLLMLLLLPRSKEIGEDWMVGVKACWSCAVGRGVIENKANRRKTLAVGGARCKLLGLRWRIQQSGTNTRRLC